MSGGILIAAYNAAPTLPAVLAAVQKFGMPIIVVDDGSNDDTSAKAQSAGVEVIRHDRNRGKGCALQTGFAAALEKNWAFCLTLDADGQHAATDIPAFLAAQRATPNALILGRRLWHRMPWPSRFTRFLGLVFLSAGSGCWQSDSQSGFRLYPQNLLRRLRLQGERYELESEVLLIAGRHQAAMRYIPIETIYHEKSARLSHFRAWRDTWRIIFMFFASLRPRWNSARWQAALVLVTLLSVSACRAPHPKTAWPVFSPSTTDADAVLHALQGRQTELHGLQAQVSVQLRGLDAAGPSMTGEILMHRPNDIRLRAYSPLGPVAFDLLYKKDHLELYLPSRQEVVVIALADLNHLEFGGTPLSIPSPASWWWMFDPWPADDATVNGDTATLALAPDRDPAHGVLTLPDRQYLFEWATGRIVEMRSPNGLSIRYEDWRVFQGREIAGMMTATLASNDGKPVTTILRLRSFHADPVIPAHAFDSVDTKALKVTRLQSSAAN